MTVEHMLVKFSMFVFVYNLLLCLISALSSGDTH